MPHISFIRKLLAASLLAMLVTSCLNYPRNGQPIATKNASVRFEGWWYHTSNAAITLWIKNNTTGQWDSIPHAPILSGGNGLTDNAGDTWYAFTADAVLPQGAAYWSAGANRTITAQVKAIGPGNTDLTTFDVSADDCIQANQAAGGAAIRGNCKSSASPAAKLNTACGAADKTCCLAAPACDFGDNCSAGNCTAACGTLGLACCAASPNCGPSTLCTSGTCTHCGNTGESCCTGNSCTAGDTCNTGTGKCETCGALGELCCPGSTCDSASLGCNTGTNKCESCGGVGEVCCPGSTCDSASSACNSGTHKCESCGGSGELCCSGSACDNASLACGGGRCKTCGITGNPCCGGSTCSGNNLCSSGTCTACGSANQVCCSNFTTCPADPSGLFCTNPGSTLSRCKPCGLQGQPCCQGTSGCESSAQYCTDAYSAGAYTCQSMPPP